MRRNYAQLPARHGGAIHKNSVTAGEDGPARKPAQIILRLFDLFGLLVVLSFEMGNSLCRQGGDDDAQTQRESRHLQKEVVQYVLTLLQPLPCSQEIIIINSRHFAG